MFLLGLQKLGKGDWRGIARNYVISRTPTQVASHAQKYFIRQSNMSRRKRRSSLFDIVADEVSEISLIDDFNAPLIKLYEPYYHHEIVNLLSLIKDVVVRSTLILVDLGQNNDSLLSLLSCKLHQLDV